MARKKISIDWEYVDKKLANFWEGTEVAAGLGIEFKTLERRIKEKYNVHFGDYKAQKRAKGESVIRELQLKTALEGNVTMQIWLGKQYLGQKDKTDHTSKGDSINPVEIVLNNPAAAKALKNKIKCKGN